MKLQIQKWGNSAAVRLPGALLAQMQANVGDALELEMSAQHAILKLAKPRYKLADLMAEMPDGLPMLQDWDAMPAVGKEQD